MKIPNLVEAFEQKNVKTIILAIDSGLPAAEKAGKETYNKNG